MCTHLGTASLGLLCSSHLLHTPQSRSDWEGVFGRISKAELGSCTVKHLGKSYSFLCFVSVRLLCPRCWGVVYPHFRFLASHIYPAPSVFGRQLCSPLYHQRNIKGVGWFFSRCVALNPSFYPSCWNPCPTAIVGDLQLHFLIWKRHVTIVIKTHFFFFLILPLWLLLPLFFVFKRNSSAIISC